MAIFADAKVIYFLGVMKFSLLFFVIFLSLLDFLRWKKLTFTLWRDIILPNTMRNVFTVTLNQKSGENPAQFVVSAQA